MRDAHGPSRDLAGEALQRLLDRLGRLLDVRELGRQVHVSEAAQQQPPVAALVPVVEAVAPVVRPLEEQLGQRFRRDHLRPCRDDQPLEPPEEPARIAVRGHDDLLGIHLVERVDARVLSDLDSCLGRCEGEPAHEPGRLQHTVGRMEERAREATPLMPVGTALRAVRGRPGESPLPHAIVYF